MLTPIDQIANQNHLQMIKAILPYMQQWNQKFFSVMIKIIEMQNIIRFYDRNQGYLQACGMSTEASGMLDILNDIRNYCEGEEQRMVDQWIQMASTLELYSMIMQSSEDFTSVSEESCE